MTKRDKRIVNLDATMAEFQAKIAAARASRPDRVVKARDDFNVTGFCKHGIPMHCPHGCGN